MDVLAFEVGERRGAIPAADVRQIVPMVRITPLPGARPGVDGAITVRGAAVPVLDLGASFGLPQRPVDPDEQLILVESGARVAALRVDRALELRRIDPACIGRPVPAAAGIAYLASAEEPILVLTDLAAWLDERAS